MTWVPGARYFVGVGLVCGAVEAAFLGGHVAGAPFAGDPVGTPFFGGCVEVFLYFFVFFVLFFLF